MVLCDRLQEDANLAMNAQPCEDVSILMPHSQVDTGLDHEMVVDLNARFWDGTGKRSKAISVIPFKQSAEYERFKLFCEGCMLTEEQGAMGPRDSLSAR